MSRQRSSRPSGQSVLTTADRRTRERAAKRVTLVLEILEPRNLLAADGLTALYAEIPVQPPTSDPAPAETNDATASTMESHHAAMHGGQMAGHDCCRILPTAESDALIAATDTAATVAEHDCCRTTAAPDSAEMMASHDCCRTMSAPQTAESSAATIDWAFSGAPIEDAHDCCRIGAEVSDAAAVADHDCCRTTAATSNADMMSSHDCCQTVSAPVTSEWSLQTTEPTLSTETMDDPHDCCQTNAVAEKSAMMADHDCCRATSATPASESSVPTIDWAFTAETISDAHDCCQTTAMPNDSDMMAAHDCCQATPTPTTTESPEQTTSSTPSPQSTSDSHACCQMGPLNDPGVASGPEEAPAPGTMHHEDTGHTMSMTDDHACCRIDVPAATTTVENDATDSGTTVAACPIPATGIPADVPVDEQHAVAPASSEDAHACCRVPTGATETTSSAPLAGTMGSQGMQSDHSCCQIPGTQQPARAAGLLMAQLQTSDASLQPVVPSSSQSPTLPAAADPAVQDWVFAAPPATSTYGETDSWATDQDFAWGDSVQQNDEFSAAVDDLLTAVPLTTGLWN